MRSDTDRGACTMQEYTSPGEVAVAPDENLTDALWTSLAEHPDRPALAHRVGDRFVEWSTRQFVEEIRAVAKGLMAIGVQKDQRIAVYSSTRIEWTVIDFAIWAAGGVGVPVYETSSADQIKWNMENSGAVAIFVESAELREV
ncbi:MAG: AMP-binding protein, partial [Actinomycetota bacterium]